MLVGHPFDTIKVHMQTQDAKNPLYRNSFHCMKSLVAKDSIRGLYRGMSSPMLGISAVNAIVFGVYGNVQRMSSNPDSYKSHFLAGSIAGCAQSLISSPMELAKTRLQVQMDMIGATKFKGPSQCLQYIYQMEGVRGVFRGLGATALRDVPGFSLYFVSYEFLMRMKNDPGISYTLFAGGMAGACSWMFTIPIDVIKTRLQTDGMNGTHQRMYHGFIDCLRKGYAAEGPVFLTRGLGSSMLRAFPMNSVCFLVVSMTLKYFDKNFCNNTRHTNLVVDQTESLISEIDHAAHKQRILQAFLHFGTSFSDAIYSNEIIELAHDWFEHHKIYLNNNCADLNP